MLILSNILIVLFGVSAIWLSQSKSDILKKYACIFGLMSQPFWFYITIHTEQWGMVLVCMLYTIGWSRGFYNNWIRKE